MHAAAHTADLVDELLLCTEAGPAELARLLQAVLQLVTRPTAPLVNAEDERLAFAACSAATRPELDPAFWERWLSSMAGSHRPDFTRMKTLYGAQNMRNFMKSFLVYAPEHKPDYLQCHAAASPVSFGSAHLREYLERRKTSTMAMEKSMSQRNHRRTLTNRKIQLARREWVAPPPGFPGAPDPESTVCKNFTRPYAFVATAQKLIIPARPV